MLENDVIDLVMSYYNSPIVLVITDGTNRFCVEFRQINLVTKKVSECDQETPQAHTTDQLIAPQITSSHKTSGRQ